MKIIHRLLPACALLFVAHSHAAETTVPTVEIATTPLYGQSQNIHPNLLLALSVEHPTTGAAYRGPYHRTHAYLGYFNNAKCYDYDATNGYFLINGDAARGTHECGGNFSGNFMNWAASSAIDELRLAMTGGDRVVDTRSQTVLQRALLQGGFFRSSGHFPLKFIDGRNGSSAPGAVTPFRYGRLYMASCGNHIFFSDVDDPHATCANPGRFADVVRRSVVHERRSFRAQIQVCDSSEATTRTDLCHSYDGTHYKPIGEMQRNADRVRFAAFGYLNDSSYNGSRPHHERYGGVLRAPMKYLGDNAVNTALNVVPNTAKEWDPYGVLLPNPLQDPSYPNSGVINYLNKFGRTMVPNLGRPVDNPLGRYKSYDPISELFYESIRYLQFHPNGPTPEAVNHITPAQAENFSVHTRWDTDPLLSSCQRNYVLTIGDINTHQDHFVPGNAVTGQGDPARPADAWSGFNVTEWTNKVGALETNTPAAGNPRPLDSSFRNLAARNHRTAQWASYYIAGIAYWAHTYGFRPTMPEARVTTFGIDVNESGNGSIGDAQRRSQIFLAAKYGGFKEELKDGGNKDGNPFKAMGPGGGTVISNAEWEAAPSGSNLPSTWFLASQPAQMIDAIKQIFAQITSSTGTLSGIAVSSNRIVQNGYVYAPGFDQQWNGKLTAHRLARGANGSVAVSPTAAWEAGARLAGRDPSRRAIFTLRSDTGAGIPFAWNSLARAQQEALHRQPGTNTSDERGPSRVAYLRGDRSQEADNQGGGGIFRGRKSIFGDIIHSGPAYVGAPRPGRADPGYAAFLSTYSARTPMVYVGANDGMVHGFNANTGDEVFAYVPNAVIPDLNQLTSPTYTHRAFVDATPVASEARIEDRWRTVLTGGFGGGAQGVYALDVTDPTGSRSGSAFGPSNVIWEFTDEDDADMGNVMGTPLVAKLLTGHDPARQPIHRWFVIVGNGLNANQPDGRANSSAPGVLFILSLDKAPGTPWSLNSNYWKVVTPTPATSPPYATANGLSTPAMLTSGNGAATALYAGDLQGNLWKFVLSGLPDTWNASANGALPPYGGTPARPMFVATASRQGGARQPITMQPQVVYAPGGHMVLFGTGKYYELADTGTGSTSGNAFYGIYDGGDARFVRDRNQLNRLTLTARDGGKSIEFSGSAAAPGHTAPRKPGWVIDFMDPSERQVTSAAVANGKVYFNSIYTTAVSCDTAGGSRSYALNTLTGMPAAGVSGHRSQTGLLSAPVVITTDVAAGTRGSVGGIPQNTTTQVIHSGTSGMTSISAREQTLSRPGRINWREIRNFKASPQ